MRFWKALVVSITAVLMACALLAPGCGGKETPSLSFPSSGTTPVIIYSSFKAISPVYNPDVPVEVIYPDGTMIKKQDSYEFTTGTLTREQIEGILKSMGDAGFFEFKDEYGGEASKPGGATEKITVNLDSGTYSVSVAGGSGPAGWSEIVDTITGAKASGEKDYVPESIVLFSKEVTQVPQGATVTPWPHRASDLAEAAAQEGLRLTGDSAASVWKTMQGVYSEGGPGSDAYWTADGKTYTYVYARPELPGLER